MKRVFVFLSIVVLSTALMFSEEGEKKRDYCGQISGGYGFADDLTLYAIGLGFDVPINGPSSLFGFSSLFDLNVQFGKTMDNSLFGITAMPGIRLYILQKKDFYFKFDLLAGLGMYNVDGIDKAVYGVNGETRLGFGYRQFQLDFGRSIFIGQQQVFKESISTITFRFLF